MTRKDYKLIAEELRIERRMCETSEELRGFDCAVSAVASALRQDNFRFDFRKFSEAVMKP